MDGSALRELPALEKEAAAALGGRPNVLLFNCALSRLSFFDKIGMASLDDVETAYVLRRVGSGFLSRVFPEDYCLWRLEPSGKLALVGSQPQPYAAQEAEATIRGS